MGLLRYALIERVYTCSASCLKTCKHKIILLLQLNDLLYRHWPIPIERARRDASPLIHRAKVSRARLFWPAICVPRSPVFILKRDDPRMNLVNSVYDQYQSWFDFLSLTQVISFLPTNRRTAVRRASSGERIRISCGRAQGERLVSDNDNDN